MGRDKSNGLFGRVGALTFHGYRFPFSLNRMYSIWRDAFRIPQLTLLSLPPPKDVKHLVRTLQNESLSNALETFSTDREGQIKLVIDFFTFVSWILRLFYWITMSTTKGWIFLNGPSCFERLWLAVLTGEHVSVCLSSSETNSVLSSWIWAAPMFKISRKIQ